MNKLNIWSICDLLQNFLNFENLNKRVGISSKRGKLNIEDVLYTAAIGILMISFFYLLVKGG